jgi:hypothetical protein
LEDGHLWGRILFRTGSFKDAPGQIMQALVQQSVSPMAWPMEIRAGAVEDGQPGARQHILDAYHEPKDHRAADDGIIQVFCLGWRQSQLLPQGRPGETFWPPSPGRHCPAVGRRRQPGPRMVLGSRQALRP